VRLGSLPEGQWRRLTDAEVSPHPLAPSPSRGEGEYDGGALSRADERGHDGGASFPSPLRGRGGEPAERAVAERGGEGQPPRPVRLRRRSA
jgi:hypothetical protein